MSATVPDCGLSIGRFRILQRTDFLWCVYDPEAPPFARSLHGKAFRSKDEAAEYARRFV